MTTASHFSLLVVDDEPDLRTLYELTLLREGYDLDTAGTVQEALLHLKDRTYSAVITTTAAAYGHQTITTLHVDQLSGDMGRVTYTYTVPKLNQVQQPWTREGGAWHYDAC